MEKPYKIAIGTALAMSILLLVIASGAPFLQNPLSYLFFGSVFFLVFGLVFSGSYYVMREAGYMYVGFLITSILLTAFLFYMDYTVWDNDPPNPGLKQIAFESAFVGSIYVAIFFATFSAAYLILRYTNQLISMAYRKLVRS